jgi:hypothetical protein
MPAGDMQALGDRGPAPGIGVVDWGTARYGGLNLWHDRVSSFD